MAQKRMTREKVVEILKILKKTYPDAKCSLEYKNPWQLLVATILSAQCTDDRVNQVTPVLFKKFKNPAELGGASISEIERIIQSTGFYKNKAKALKESSQVMVERYDGQVPEDLEKLTHLRGVGRKTANVVLGNAFGIPAMVVDTHVGRLSRRIGFARHQDPVKVEYELMKLVPKEDWTIYSHLMIAHGRAICTARKAFCEKCPILSLCPQLGVAQPD